MGFCWIQQHKKNSATFSNSNENRKWNEKKKQIQSMRWKSKSMVIFRVLQHIFEKDKVRINKYKGIDSLLVVSISFTKSWSFFFITDPYEKVYFSQMKSFLDLNFFKENRRIQLYQMLETLKHLKNVGNHYQSFSYNFYKLLSFWLIFSNVI